MPMSLKANSGNINDLSELSFFDEYSKPFDVVDHLIQVVDA